MSGWHPPTAPPIILATQCEAWTSAIVRHFPPPYRIVRALDIDEVILQARPDIGCVAIVEVSPKQVLKVCKKLSSVINDPQEIRWLAVGDQLSADAILGLRHAGFEAVCTKPIAVRSLLTTINLALESAYRPLQTIEEQVQNGLPFSTMR